MHSRGSLEVNAEGAGSPALRACQPPQVQALPLPNSAFVGCAACPSWRIFSNLGVLGVLVKHTAYPLTHSAQCKQETHYSSVWDQGFLIVSCTSFSPASQSLVEYG